MSSVPKVHLTSQQIPYGINWGYVKDFDAEALLASEGHYRMKNGRWSGGGPFYKIRQTRKTEGQNSYSWLLNGNQLNWSSGGVTPLASATIPSWATMIASFPSYANQVSSSKNRTQFVSAWNRTLPGNPIASLGQFVYELRDLPSIPLASFLKGIPFSRIPHEMMARVKQFQNYGSEYLNYVFGWKPFIKDVRQVYNLMHRIDKEMAQIIRDNGKAIKRKTRFAEEKTTENVTSGSLAAMQGQSALAPVSALASGDVAYNYSFANVLGVPTTLAGTSVFSRTVTTSRRAWYSASYSYFVPDVNSWQWQAKTKAILFGAYPSPDLVWSIMPWSWLVDWFGNVGDFYKYHLGANSLPSTVATRSYLMVTESREESASCTTRWPSIRNPSPYSPSWIDGGSATISTKITRETKMRMGATPFGLGATYSGLSNSQRGILAALGLSRSNF